MGWYCYRGTHSRRSHLTYTPTERAHTETKNISFGKKVRVRITLILRSQKIKSSMSIILQNGCWAMSDFEKEMDDKLASSSQHHHYTCKKRNIIILNKISSSLSSNTIDFHIISLQEKTIFFKSPPTISYNHQHRPIKNPKIHKRWPILFFKNKNFLQGRPPKISYNII